MTILESAILMCRRGWSVIPIPYQCKNPGFAQWEQLRLVEQDLPLRFANPRMNIGVLLGEPSRWLIDIDLDHLRCVELADRFLPPTPAVFGRPGKPRSHRLFYVTAAATTRKFKSRSAGMLVEFRSTGTQTVFPPSTHEKGEPITWDVEGAEPATIDPETLLDRVERLADEVMEELGERPTPRIQKPESGTSTAPSPMMSRHRRNSDENLIRECVAAMLRMHLTDHNDGSSRLFAAACRVVEHDLDTKTGIAAIRDYARLRPFPVEWTDDQIGDRIQDAERKTQRGVIRCADHGKQKIVVDYAEHRVTDEAIDALAADPLMYQRGGSLVRVLREPTQTGPVKRVNGSPTISILPLATLRERLTQYAQFTQFQTRRELTQEIPVHPPAWLTPAVDARGEWKGIRHLHGITDVPILRPDGTLCQTPGYDEQTGVLYQPADQLPIIAENVGIDDAVAAVNELSGIVCDFKFETPDHRSAWLAGLLSPLARFAFSGPAPLFLIDANIRGAGKGMLVQTIGQIVLGREMPASSYAHDPEEMRKKVTTIAIGGDLVVNLDNVAGPFGNHTLDRALTSTRWKDRILGKSQEVDLPLIPIWYATGNNVAVTGDIARRIVHIRLDILEENPEKRLGFKHVSERLKTSQSWAPQNQPLD